MIKELEKYGRYDFPEEFRLELTKKVLKRAGLKKIAAYIDDEIDWCGYYDAASLYKFKGNFYHLQEYVPIGPYYLYKISKKEADSFLEHAHYMSYTAGEEHLTFCGFGDGKIIEQYEKEKIGYPHFYSRHAA